MGDKNIVISIVVPVYNVEKYIQECLDSLVSQDVSYEDYEIICVDDGSTDRSSEILDEYGLKFNNIIVIHKSNGGVSSARNCGIDKANGKYIWFVDSDDFILKNSLSKIFNVLNNKTPDLLFVKPLDFVDGEEVSKLIADYVREGEISTQYDDWLWTRIIKTSIIKKSGVYFNTDISMAEDHMFCTMLNPYINDILSHDELVYFYRRRDNSLSTSPTINRLDGLIKSCKAFMESGINGIIDYDVAMKEVCILMASVMSTIATLPKSKASIKIRELKEKKLFPIEKSKNYSPEYSLDGLNWENRILTKLKYKSFTLSGYYKLRFFRFTLKIKRKLFR